MTRLSSREVDDLAANWAAGWYSGNFTVEEQAQLDRWLAEDDRHFGAYAKARAVLEHTAKAIALGPDFDPAKREERTPQSGGVPFLRRRAVMVGGAAASVAFAVGSIGVIQRLLEAKVYVTAIGETHVVPLEDGSIVTLNTNSKIAVNYSKELRGISLLRGEALFDVAKDKARPFVVEAGGTSVRAVGTSFTVSVLPRKPVEVLIREGVVEVTRPAIPEAPAVRLVANHRATVSEAEPIKAAVLPVPEVQRALSWRVGRVSFEGETLASAAETFSRYSKTPITIDDPSVARQTITGVFVSNDPVGFAKAAALSLGLRAEVTNDEVRLTR